MYTRIKHWFRDGMIRTLFRNAGILLSGNIFASILGLITLGLTARALGPELFGLLVLVQTFILVIDGLVNFQSWQALIKYGTDLKMNIEKGPLKSLIKFGFIVDITTAIFGTMVAIIIAYFFSSSFNIQKEYSVYAILYSFVILFHISGTPTAILRLFDKFKMFALKNVIASSIKLVGVAACFFTKSGFISFLIVWIITDIINHLLLLFLGLKVFKEKGYGDFYKSNLKNIHNYSKGIVKFILTTNLNSSVRMTSRQFDILLVGAILGGNSVGLYKIAKQFASILSKLIDPLYQSIYPQLTNLIANKNIVKFKELIMKTSILATTFAIIIWTSFLFFGDFFIKFTVGKEFLEMNNVLLWYMFAIVLSIGSFALQPAMLALNKPNLSFVIQLASTLLYFAFLFPLLNIVGLNGAGIAYVIYYIIWILFMSFFVYKNTKLIKSNISVVT